MAISMSGRHRLTGGSLVDGRSGACFGQSTVEQYSAILSGDKPEFCVERKCGYIAGSDLDASGLATLPVALGKELIDQSIAGAEAPELRFDMEVINVAAQTTMLHGVAEGEYRMSARDLNAPAKRNRARGSTVAQETRLQPIDGPR